MAESPHDQDPQLPPTLASLPLFLQPYSLLDEQELRIFEQELSRGRLDQQVLGTYPLGAARRSRSCDRRFDSSGWDDCWVASVFCGSFALPTSGDSVNASAQRRENGSPASLLTDDLAATSLIRATLVAPSAFPQTGTRCVETVIRTRAKVARSAQVPSVASPAISLTQRSGVIRCSARSRL